ncbi:MAG: alpha/beta fold hydrolase [Gammaproteobacteria bacterium]|nr:MAG: alpha/beta fold hydrolase [Gammaproteobacteria bacterium]
MKMLWALHGQLQTDRVWKHLPLPAGWQLEPVDLWADRPVSLTAFAGALNRQRRLTPGDTHVLMGYSLGGRLAMAAATAAPELWHGLVVVAAHPGLTSVEKRLDALAKDRHWARRFREEPTETVLDDWYALPVFAGMPPALRFQPGSAPTDFIAEAYDAWSKGRQPDYSDALGHLPFPVHYISGAQDATYTALGQHLHACAPNVQTHVIDGAGHRVPWEQPAAFEYLLNQILTSM